MPVTAPVTGCTTGLTAPVTGASAWSAVCAVCWAVSPTAFTGACTAGGSVCVTRATVRPTVTTVFSTVPLAAGAGCPDEPPPDGGEADVEAELAAGAAETAGAGAEGAGAAERGTPFAGPRDVTRGVAARCRRCATARGAAGVAAATGATVKRTESA